MSTDSRHDSKTLPLPAGSSLPQGGPVALDAIAGISPDLPRLGPFPVLGELGAGGMGQVFRVLDPYLNRPMAMKVLLEQWTGDPLVSSRFIEEAQATAQLQHPGIVPVHQLGQLPDGRWYFTMQEVQGRTLKEVITHVHAASFERWTPTEDGWTFRRLVDAFHKVCEAVAYAHARGVVHRDLKPSNVLLGELGQVLVVDWGIAKVMGRPDLATVTGALREPVRTSRAGDTLPGLVAGTPAFMPPEQARGELDRVDQRSDVYSLGAILFQLLWGHRPYKEVTPDKVLSAVLRGPPRTPVDSVPTRPQELRRICARAMSRDREDRYANGQKLADAVQSWLDGSRLREQAREEVDGARTLNREAAELQHQAATIRRRADRALTRLAPWASEQEKAPAWAQRELAQVLEQTARARLVEAQSRLQGALAYAPDLPEAHAALASLHRRRHEEAEASRDDTEALRAEALLRAHALALPMSSPVRAGHEAYLRGDGRLTLHTDPAGAQVRLYRYEMHRQRLVPVFARELGRTPLDGVTLPQGSWLLELQHPERATVRYPVNIARQEHWDGVPPGWEQPMPVHLPHPDALGADECYVPAGWTWVGGDPDARASGPRQRVWQDGFAISRHPVTNAQYIAFLEDLVAQGREQEALRYVPRERAGAHGSMGSQIYARTPTGGFTLRADADGDLWRPQWPVLMIDWYGARAYARWRAVRESRSWRLPMTDEWSKAARGVDGRFFPWGDHFDPSWCAMRDSQPKGQLRPVPVGTFSVDESVYGVRDLAGNAKDWCLEARRERRVVRGGHWQADGQYARCATTGEEDPHYRAGHIGFRLARPFPALLPSGGPERR
ncbi:MAG: SUMF1/EgtB/PvdO family nonheme iron enzyme [Myxococcota bacterium]|nr:SUMF1/EgtB/PvdO family nonheme iron enzyme [Myxococcota bacterium]